jgi:roadblock/LC7 domain-containing protein
MKKELKEMNRFELLGLTKDEANKIDDMIVVDYETGEVVLADELHKLITDKNDKIMSYQRICASNAEMFKAQAKAFAELAKIWEKKANAILENEKNFMVAAGKKKIVGKWGQASLRKSTVVEITDDPAVLDSLYSAYPEVANVKITPKKTEIKKLLKSGEQLEGCALVERENISVK